MNQLYQKIWAKIIQSHKITILTHINPDGDTVGSAVALKHLILTNTQNIEVKISGEKVPHYLTLFDENELVNDNYFNDSQVIVVDTSNKKRIFDQRLVTKEAIKIDHHHEEEEWLLAIGGDHWPATGEVLYQLAIANALVMTKRAQEAIFVAIWTDTEGMTQRNFTKITQNILDTLDVNKAKILDSLKLPHELKDFISSLKKQMIIDQNVAYLFYSDSEVDNDYLRLITAELSNMTGFEVYVGMIKTTKGTFRGSLRSKGKLDVSQFAKMLAGGGHFSSSGFSEQDVSKVEKVINLIKSELKQR